MAQLTPEDLQLVKAALEQYRVEVYGSKLRPSTKQTFFLHAKNFVRWIEGDFEPGRTLK